MEVGGTKFQCNPQRITEFFNQVELDDDNLLDGKEGEGVGNVEADLDLLVEAERRCLLDPVTAELLQRAREYGLLPNSKIVKRPSWKVHSYGNRSMLVEPDNHSNIFDAIRDKAYETVSVMHESGVCEEGIITFSSTGLHIGGTDIDAIPTIHIVRTLDHGPHVMIIVRIKTPSKERSEPYNCYAIRCSSGDEALEIRAHIEKICNYHPETDNRGPLLYDIKIAFGDDADFTGNNIAGAQIRHDDNDGGVIIREIVDYSPASTGGLAEGMKIVAVQGSDTQFASVEKVMSLVKEHAVTGMDVTITVLDLGSTSVDRNKFKLHWKPRDSSLDSKATD